MVSFLLLLLYLNDDLKSSVTNHNHDTVYSKLGHNHDSSYSKTDHSHGNYMADIYVGDDGKLHKKTVGGADTVIPFSGGGGIYKINFKPKTYLNNNNHPGDMNVNYSPKFEIMLDTTNMTISVNHLNSQAGVQRSDGGVSAYNAWTSSGPITVEKVE